MLLQFVLIPPLDFFARGILCVTVAIIFFNFFGAKYERGNTRNLSNT